MIENQMPEIGPSVIFGDEFARYMAEMPLNDDETVTELAKPRILVVDDERLIADTCSEILEGAGFDVRRAYEGSTALEIASEFRPDYLLTDVLMPRMNGVELAICISKMLPSAKILLFSGQAGISQILLQGRERGYEFELLAKPIHQLELINHFESQKR
jgi:CheY-like chemotaxis protein